LLCEHDTDGRKIVPRGRVSLVHFGEGTKDALQDVSLGSMVMSSRETWLQTSHNQGRSQDFDQGGG
jgi:hypothetical protein